ncbi:MAG TPA: hypothetical protein VE153_40300, partial [Myxococcus sp.]|nr:hypothetical protein [Myxococcus sp.]
MALSAKTPHPPLPLEPDALASPVPLPTTPVPDAEARLALAEQLLACDAPGACAEAVVAWLAPYLQGGVAACLVREERGERMVCAAARGLSARQKTALEFHPRQDTHPLAEVLAQAAPHFFPAPRAPLPALGAGGFFAVPLGRPGAPA